MRRATILLLIAACAILLPRQHAAAQRCLPGMRTVELRYGMVDGFRADDFSCGVTLARYTKHAHRWVLGGEYLRTHFDAQDVRIPREQYTAEGGFYVRLLADPAKIFFLSVGGSGMLGYERCNSGRRLLPDDTPLADREAFLYGGAATVELECYLCDRIALGVHVRERLLWGTDHGIAQTQFGVALKIVIN